MKDTLGTATALPAAIYCVALDPTREVLFVNDEIGHLTGYAPSDFYGDRNLLGRIVHAEDRAEWHAACDRSPASRSQPLRLRLVRRDGSIIWTEHRFGAVTAKGRQRAVTGLVIDVTSQVDTEALLRTNAARLAEAQRIAKIGNWDWHLATNELWWSDEVYRIFGMTDKSFGGTYESFLAIVHPADQSLVNDAVDRALSHNQPYSIEHRIVLADGSEKIVHEQAEVTVDSAGKAIRMAGTVHDVTARKTAEEALTNEQRRVRALLDAMPDMIFRMDRRGVFLDFSGPKDAPLLFPPEDFLGKSVHALFPRDHADASLAHACKAIETGELQTFEYELLRDDKPEHFEARFVRSGKDEVVAVIRDVTHAKQAAKRIEELTERLRRENTFLRDAARLAGQSQSIVCNTAAMKNCVRQAEIVAPTNVPVLLLGETGTGKELFARAIHNMSDRHERVLVSVNCPALPANIIESELFGHEKGAFTGAHARRIGRFEAANGGTLFLDEIGDLPLELQGKLLRVIQESEFERLGGSETIRVDVRLIAATNRDLHEAVKKGEFRPDLYYRISSYPLQIPPLRERREDIGLLAEHFLNKHAAALKKNVVGIAPAMLTYLENNPWPGNVRELEGFIVRALISSTGPILELPEALPPQAFAKDAGRLDSNVMTLSDAERRHILSVLEEAGWVITGRQGAAHLLGVPPSTLRSRMARLGIRRPRAGPTANGSSWS